MKELRQEARPPRPPPGLRGLGWGAPGRHGGLLRQWRPRGVALPRPVQGLDPFPRSSLRFLRGGVHGNQVDQKLCRVVVRLAREPLSRKVGKSPRGGAGVARPPAWREQQDVVELFEDCGARLVDAHQHHCPFAPRQIHEGLHDPVRLEGVKSSRGLVRDEHGEGSVGLGAQKLARDREAPPLPARDPPPAVPTHHRVRAPSQPEPAYHIFHPLFGRPSGVLQARDEDEGLSHGELGEEGGVLWHESDAVRRRGDLSGHPDLARVGVQVPAEV